MRRRDFTDLLTTLLIGSSMASAYTRSIYATDGPFVFHPGSLPSNLPENIRTMITVKVLSESFKTVNTDWLGSIQIEGILRFAHRGYKKGYEFACDWFNYHLEHDGNLTDEEYYAQYEGARSRILRRGPLTFGIYSALFGVLFQYMNCI